jgi:hypothetical protein
MNQIYDIVGDIHGHAELLIELLKKMGYEECKGAWRHSERLLIFLGDFIDLGPRQVETVSIVRQMIEAGSALAVMGNHEFNAIAWYMRDSRGYYLRPHFSKKYGRKNWQQHKAFLAEVESEPDLHREIVDWFLTLPLWLDLPELRIVHACWHPRFMDYLAPMLLPGTRLSKELMPEVTREPEDAEKDSPEPSPFKAAEALMKGIEIPLPEGCSFKDEYGFERSRVRVRWWDAQAMSYCKAAMADGLFGRLPESPIPVHARVNPPTDKPIFFGHYWLTGQPYLQSSKIVCLDYSAGKGGPLCAYRWVGEKSLNASHFCWVDPSQKLGLPPGHYWDNTEDLPMDPERFALLAESAREMLEAEKRAAALKANQEPTRVKKGEEMCICGHGITKHFSFVNRDCLIQGCNCKALTLASRKGKAQ